MKTVNRDFKFTPILNSLSKPQNKANPLHNFNNKQYLQQKIHNRKA